MIFVLTIVVVVIIAIICSKKQKNEYVEQKKIHDQIKDCVSYDPIKEILTISRRDPNFAKLFKIVEYKKTEFGHTPEKLVYTGATVGGVTTGGVHKSGGYYAQEGRKSGKFNLYYRNDNGTSMVDVPVERIKLSPELAEEARASQIREYVKGTKIFLFDKIEMTTEAVMAMKAGHKDYAFNLHEQAKVDASPTYEKCISIVNWLSGIDE